MKTRRMTMIKQRATQSLVEEKCSSWDPHPQWATQRRKKISQAQGFSLKRKGFSPTLGIPTLRLSIRKIKPHFLV